MHLLLNLLAPPATDVFTKFCSMILPSFIISYHLKSALQIFHSDLKVWSEWKLQYIFLRVYTWVCNCYFSLSISFTNWCLKSIKIWMKTLIFYYLEYVFLLKHILDFLYLKLIFQFLYCQIFMAWQSILILSYLNLLFTYRKYFFW